MASFIFLAPNLRIRAGCLVATAWQKLAVVPQPPSIRCGRILRHRHNEATSAATKTTTDPEKVREAVRKHREIQNLMGSSSSGSTQEVAAMNRKQSDSSSSTPQELLRQQRYRQAVINSALSFLVVIIAAQGVKNGQERRKAQMLQEQAEKELLETKALLRSLASESVLRPLAQECARAVVVDVDNHHQGWRKWFLLPVFTLNSTTASAATATTSIQQDMDADREQRILNVLVRGFSAMAGTAVMTPEEKELKEMEQLAIFSSLNTGVVDVVSSSSSSTSSSNGDKTEKKFLTDGQVDDGDSESRAKPKKVFAF